MDPTTSSFSTTAHNVSFSSPGKNIPLQLPLASCLGCTSHVLEPCPCSPCRLQCGGAVRLRKSLSTLTMAPFATWDRADPHRAGCLPVLGRHRRGKTRIPPHLYTPRFSWTIQHHSSWSTQTTHPGPSQLPQRARLHVAKSCSLCQAC